MLIGSLFCSILMCLLLGLAAAAACHHSGVSSSVHEHLAGPWVAPRVVAGDAMPRQLACIFAGMVLTWSWLPWKGLQPRRGDGGRRKQGRERAVDRALRTNCRAVLRVDCAAQQCCLQHKAEAMPHSVFAKLSATRCPSPSPPL